MKSNRKKIAVIKPHKSSNPEVQSQMYSCVDVVMRAKEKLTGYAFVSFHEEGAFHAFYTAPPSLDIMDIPEAVKSRLLAKIIKTMESV